MLGHRRARHGDRTTRRLKLSEQPLDVLSSNRQITEQFADGVELDRSAPPLQGLTDFFEALTNGHAGGFSAVRSVCPVPPRLREISGPGGLLSIRRNARSDRVSA